MKLPRSVKLWPHQKKAVETVRPYLEQYAHSKARQKSSALVNIPTGGGKTAIIGALAHWHPTLRTSLLLAPRTAIRDQLFFELSARRGFFKRCGLKPDDLPRKVIRLGSAQDIPQKVPRDAILIGTIQLINDLARSRGSDDAYDRLAKSCDAIFVDEGHYEPAQTWSQSIRGLGRPIVLVTATPYRNDLKPFEFDDSAIYVCKYSELLAERFLRKVEVVRAPHAALRNPSDFMNSILDEFVSYYGEPPSQARKLIIRCRTRDHIQQIGDLIKAHRHGGGGVLCLHEAFTRDPLRPWERRQPTDPEADDAPAIWVHQHKLLEGVDGPSFRALAFYGVLGSARALVQQIGRVIRNPLRDGSEHALMIDHSEGLLGDMWERFLEYDDAISTANMRRGLDDFAREFEKSLPPVVYADRQFRRRFSFGVPPAQIRTSLRLPLRCHLYAAAAGVDLSRLVKATEDRLLDAEFPSETVIANENEIVILFEKLQTSPLLAEHFFIERELHAFVATRHGSIVAILDTSRAGLDQKALAIVGRPLSRQHIARLLIRSPDTRLVEVNTRNAALGPGTVRRRSATAASLEETPPALDEFQFVASSMTAINGQIAAANPDPDEDMFSIRSVGFGLGRVTDMSVRKPLDEWKAWTARLISASSDATRQAPSYLQRFASPLENVPPEPWPRTVLIDLEEARKAFVTADAASSPLDIDDACLECTHTSQQESDPRAIEIVANGTTCVGTFAFDPALQRYILESELLARRYRPDDGTRVGNLVDFLNTNQAFVVVPDSNNAIYSEGGFFDPRLGLGPQFDPGRLGLDDMIITVPELRGCRSEKGAPASATPGGWANNSVFHWIDNNRERILPNADLILCDDGQHESCDFLFVGKRNGRETIVMVHAKANKDGSYVSASSLHEVCGQAAKQVGTIAQFGAVRPAQVNLWDGGWDGPNGEGHVNERLRRSRRGWAGLTGLQVWDRVQAILGRQGTEREVVLVLGASLDRNRLFIQARKARPPGPAVHAVHLLRSTMAAVGGVNARLRIFCG